MKQFFRNFLALLLAFTAAYLVTSGIIILGHSIVPVTEAMDTNNFESIKSNFHLFEMRHFIFPFLAHAIGTFVSAYVVCFFAVGHEFMLALGIGALFMLASLSLRLGYFHWIGLLELGI